MKKQIAILATMLAASGFTAYGQDWLLFSTANTIKEVWDESTTAGVGTIGDTSGLYDVSFLWAATGTADPLTSIGTAGNFGQQGQPANDQVATNGVTSVGTALSTIQTMLGSGWNIANNIGSGSGTATTGMAITQTSTSGKITQYNQNAGNASAFDLSGGTGVSGSQIEIIVIAWNLSATLGNGATTFANVGAFGYSNPFNDTVGSNAGDPNDGPSFNSLTAGAAYNSFGVAPVPEPTTLALAGLGGLSMLFLRRRKA